MSTNNQQILKDAITSEMISNNGVMNRKQADKFIQMVFDTTPLLKASRTIKMDAPKQEIGKIGVGSRVMRGYKSELEDFSKFTVRPTFGKIELDAQKYGLPWEFTEDALEDNIEGKTFENIVANMFAKAMGIDMEDVAINGDTVSPPDTQINMGGGLDNITDPVDITVQDISGYPRTSEAGWIKIEDELLTYESIDVGTNTFKNCSRAQNNTAISAHANNTVVSWFSHPLIGVDDGWLKQIYIGKSHYVDFSSINAGELTKKHFFELQRAMPKKYTRSGGASSLRWLMSPFQFNLWKEYLTDRPTGAGDAVLGGAEPKPLGIAPMEVSPMPDDIIVLADPSNFITGFWRRVKVKKSDMAKESVFNDLIFYNSTVRWDFKIEEEDAIAFGDGLKAF